MMSKDQMKPKFELSVYRNFIREASPYVSLIIGKKIKPADADLMSEEALTAIALLIDSRVSDLNKPPSGGGRGSI